MPLTADATPETRQLTHAAGIHHVWHKPLEAPRVLAEIDALLAALALPTPETTEPV